MSPDQSLHTRLRLGGILIGVGLLVEVLTLFWSHPLSFMTFMFLSGVLVAAGVLLYLWSIVSET